MAEDEVGEAGDEQTSPEARPDSDPDADPLADLRKQVTLRVFRRLEFLRWLYEQPDHGGL